MACNTNSTEERCASELAVPLMIFLNEVGANFNRQRELNDETQACADRLQKALQDDGRVLTDAQRDTLGVDTLINSETTCIQCAIEELNNGAQQQVRTAGQQSITNFFALVNRMRAGSARNQVSLPNCSQVSTVRY